MTQDVVIAHQYSNNLSFIGIYRIYILLKQGCTQLYLILHICLRCFFEVCNNIWKLFVPFNREQHVSNQSYFFFSRKIYMLDTFQFCLKVHTLFCNIISVPKRNYLAAVLTINYIYISEDMHLPNFVHMFTKMFRKASNTLHMNCITTNRKTLGFQKLISLCEIQTSLML